MARLSIRLSQRWALLAMTVAAAARGQSTPLCARTAVAPIAPPSSFAGEAATAGITKFSFIVYGDTRGPRDSVTLQPNHEKVLESMLAKIKERSGGPGAVRFVLQTGDAVTDGRVAEQWNVSYTPSIDRITVGANIPVFLAAGNHDVTSSGKVDSPGRITGLCNYFAANERLIPPAGSAHRLKDYPDYGFGFGNTFFLAFDPDISNDTTQFFWVKAQLDGLDRRRYPNIVVFVHQPPISTGPHGGPRVEPASADFRTFYTPLFRQHHVLLLLAGHEHLFEHWVERYRDSTGAHRLDEIVTGGGGAPAYAYSGEPDLRGYLAEASAEGLAVEHLVRPSRDPRQNPLHYVVVSVDGAEVRVEVVGVDGGSGPGKDFAPYAGSRSAILVDRP